MVHADESAKFAADVCLLAQHVYVVPVQFSMFHVQDFVCILNITLSQSLKEFWLLVAQSSMAGQVVALPVLLSVAPAADRGRATHWSETKKSFLKQL